MSDIGFTVNGVNAEFLSVVAIFQKYSYREDDLVWGWGMVVLCILLVIVCFVLNGVVLKFYFKKREDVVCLIYSLLSLAGGASSFCSFAKLLFSVYHVIPLRRCGGRSGKLSDSHVSCGLPVHGHT